MVLLLLVFTTAIGFASYRSGQRTAEEFTIQLQNEVSRHILQYLGGYLATPRQVTQTNAAALSLERLTLEDWQVMGSYFWEQMQAFEIQTLFYSEAMEGQLLLSRQEDGTARLYRNTEEMDEWNMIPMSRQGRFLPASEDIPRSLMEILNQVAMQPASEPLWQHLPSGNLLAIAPIYGPTGDLRGTLGVETDIAPVGSFLRQLTLSQGGQAFLVDRQGELIASSAPQHLRDEVSQEGSGRELMDVLNSPNSTIRTAANVLLNEFGSLGNVQGTQILAFSQANRHYSMQVTPLRDEWGLDWLVVVAIPKTEFMEPIWLNLMIIGVLGLIATITAAVMGCQLATWLSQPLRQLTKSMAQLGRRSGSVTIPLVVDDSSQEVGVLGKSFNRLALRFQTTVARLEQENGALRETDRLKDLYLHNLAEEFRKPIEEAIERVQGLSDRPHEYSQQDRRDLNRLRKLGQRLLELMEDISDLTQIHSGQMTPQLTGVELETLLDEVVEAHRPLLQEANLDLERRDFPPPLRVTADREMLKQVLEIILENAIQFTEDGSITVSTAISAPMGRTSYHELPEAVIAISDSGIGIDPQQQEKLFQPFAKIEGCPESRRGPGLGLAIAANLVSLMSGKIFVDSEGCGQGTTVTILLPVSS
ncbi:sensor histidine kinase [Phormidium yuhuli AB48]|uniref:histidine kinase n=1 Tax=Phormidium yuhuli AB48 TaxID=2940671 RepID=A0ABY5AVV9_9CYAN|nr:sensor histidine kinase [Phormidium yuhuli]USR93016.1 sensor histidine kinase [Phormidium yuhuli AB48]